MTNAEFRRIALSMPEATEGAHMGHPDFRVKGKIFATLFTRDGVEWGMVKLKPEQQRQFVATDQEVFAPVKGGWGRQGCTQVRLDGVNEGIVRRAIVAAWLNTAPKRLIEEQAARTQSRGLRRRTGA